MNCPKCGGGAFLAEEDLVKVMDNVQPMKLLVKQTFTCRACSEKFSRIVWDDFESRKKGSESPSGSVETVSLSGGEQDSSVPAASSTPEAGIQFLDKV
jgi:hypothetical protein